MKENKRHLQREQLETLQELGAYLRQCRIEQGVSIEDVAASTRIPARLLNAIEAGRLDQLPEPVYIQAFIRHFADFLGLDGETFAHEFPAGSNFVRIKPSWQHLSITQLRPLHLYLLYILLVIGAVNALSSVVSRSAVQLQNSTSQAKQFSQPQIEVSQPIQINQPTENGKPVQVGVTLKAQSWIRVVVDGKTEFEGVLPEGTQRTWVADEKLSVRAGNAGGVLVEFNDQTAQQMGAPGAVKEVTFAAANSRS